MHKRLTSTSSNSLSRSACARFVSVRFIKIFSLFLALVLAGSLSGFSFAHAETDEIDQNTDNTPIEVIDARPDPDKNDVSQTDKTNSNENIEPSTDQAEEQDDPIDQLKEGGNQEVDITDPQTDMIAAQNEELVPQADTTITNKTTTWSNGVYTLSSDVTITSRIQVSMGTVTLQLNEGCTLNAEGGISVPIGATLIIQGEGTLNASTNSKNTGCAVIGGEASTSSSATGHPGTGTIQILSGNINVTRGGVEGSAARGAGIGSGYNCLSGNVIISGGVVKVDADREVIGEGAAIGAGSGAYTTGINVTINGGTVVAYGPTSACAIGGGNHYAATGKISIAGGTVRAIGRGGYGGIGGVPQGNFSLGDLSKADPSTVQLYTSSIPANLLENNSNLNGIIFVDNDATVYGKAALDSNLELTSSQKLTVLSDATFTIPQDVSLEDNGEIINEGTVLNSGSITGTGVFTNNGTFTNTGVFFPQSVSFNTDGGSQIDSISINKGSFIGDITEPTREGYRFDGWFSDSALLHPWNLTTDAVDSPLTLYAKWSPLAVDPDPDDPTPPGGPDNPTNPDDPNEPADPSDPDDGDNEDDSNREPDQDADNPADDGTGQENNNDDAEEGSSSDEGSLLPHLGDQVMLIIPVFFGMLGILIVLNFDKAKRYRKLMH